MSLEEQLKFSPKGGSNQGLPCSVGELLATLPPEEAATLRTALATPWRIMGHQRIEDALLAEGHYVGTGAIGKHRRKTCRCSKAAR